MWSDVVFTSQVEVQQFRPTCCPIRCLSKISANKRGGENAMQGNTQKHLSVSYITQNVHKYQWETFSTNCRTAEPRCVPPVSWAQNLGNFSRHPACLCCWRLSGRLSHGWGLLLDMIRLSRSYSHELRLSVRSLLQTFSLTWFFFFFFLPLASGFELFN